MRRDLDTGGVVVSNEIFQVIARRRSRRIAIVAIVKNRVNTADLENTFDPRQLNQDAVEPVVYGDLLAIDPSVASFIPNSQIMSDPLTRRQMGFWRMKELVTQTEQSIG